MDRVVVIGGAGFIGRVLTALLVRSGHDVSVVSRSVGSRVEEPGIRYSRGESSDANRMTELIEGAACVYDLSMSLGDKWEDYERDYIGGTRNIARACLKHGVSRLIYTSSTSALYLGSGKRFDESDGYDSQPLKRGFYSRGKIEAERVLMQMHAAEKLPAVIVRPAIVLGLGGALVHGAFGDIVSEVRILGVGSGKHPLPCVLVNDVAEALFRAKDANGIEGMAFNLAGDVRPTALEYVEELRRRAKRNFRYYPRSIWNIALVENLRWVGKAVGRKPGNVCLSMREIRSGTMCSFIDCSLAKRVLGWKPVSDREEFFHKAIDPHIPPFHPTDLRLLPSFRAVYTGG